MFFMNNEPQQPETVQSEAAKPVKESIAKEVKPVDRSAYNCPNCGGTGLQDQDTICPKCAGTGKV